MREIIYHFKDGSILDLEVDEKEDYEKRFESLGFFTKSTSFDPHYYPHVGNSFIELMWFSDGRTHIIELWNCYEGIVIFYAKNEEVLEFLSKMLDIAERFISIEMKLKKLFDDTRID